MALRLWHNLLDLVFPPCCVGCGQVDVIMCTDCRRLVVRVQPPACPCCARPVSTPADASASACQSACPICSIHPLRLDGVRAAAEFSGAVRPAIHDLKYEGRTEIAPLLAEIMAPTWREEPCPADYVVPVPLHPGRLRERGYNQAVLLAKALVCEVDLPLLMDGLTRTRMTTSQTRLRAAERRQNVASAFAAEPRLVADRAVLRVDDVCTARATLQAYADALLAGGAAATFAITAARASWDPQTGTATDSAIVPIS